MKSNSAKNLICICLIAVLLAVALALPLSCEAAYGATYGDNNFEDLWYNGENALNFAAAKSVTDGWDKSKLSKKVIAVIDTGIDSSHELFDGVLLEDADGRAVGYDARSGLEVAASELKDNSSEKHGNSVAGVFAMYIKEFGLSEFVKIYPIKANTVENNTDVDTFKLDTVVKALKRAAEINADVVNLSLGLISSSMSSGTNWQNSSELRFALEETSKTALIVAAAGNNRKISVSELFYPAAHSGVYSVMSYGKDGNLYSTSNYGPAYDVAAPGEDIYSAYGKSGNLYHDMKGTSLSTPIAAFAGVLLKLRYEAEGMRALSGTLLSLYMRNLDLNTIEKDGVTVKLLNFSAPLTQDFENTPINYSEPTGLSLKHNGTLGKGDYRDSIFMYANDVQPVRFFATVLPADEVDPDIADDVKWYLCRDLEDTEGVSHEHDVYLGEGISLDYIAEEYGEYYIVARLKYGGRTLDAKQSVYIQYAEYYVGEVRVTYLENANDSVQNAPSSGVLYTTETTKFSLTGIKYVDKTVEIKWFVDGELVATGEVFEYTPKKAGKHIISAQYGDNPRISTTYVFTAEVRPFIARPLDLSMLVIGFAIAVTVIAIAIVSYRKRKKAPLNGADEQINP